MWRAHSALGPAEDVIRQRRTLYAVAIELLEDVRRDEALAAAAEPDILDNPVVRGHLGQVLAGRGRFDLRSCRPRSDLIDPALTTSVYIASSVQAAPALAGALERVAAEMTGKGNPTSLLTSADSGTFDDGLAVLHDGISLAAQATPFALVSDADRLGSASTRDYPGLVVLPVPTKAVEAAEGLIHEGAHQKFFDLAVTRDMLGPDQVECPPYAPPWADPASRDWPLEQTFAAWHAYSCLAALAEGLAEHGVALPSVGSLLPVAQQRAEILGKWLLGHGQFLGIDARILLSEISGGIPEGQVPPVVVDIASIRECADVVRPCGEKVLVAINGRPPDMFWLPAADAGDLVEAFS
jgi:hypothetical protein